MALIGVHAKPSKLIEQRKSECVFLEIAQIGHVPGTRRGAPPWAPASAGDVAYDRRSLLLLAQVR
jgi:hypothetical protein